MFGYRALVALTEAFVASQRELRVAVEIRIRAGASAEGDLPRIDSYIAQAQTRLARFRRLLASAEARYTELTGSPPKTSSETRGRGGDLTATKRPWRNGSPRSQCRALPTPAA